MSDTFPITRAPRYTPPAEPIGYAVIEEREGEYGHPVPARTWMVGEIDEVTGQPWDDHDARVEAGARTTTLNDRDAEGASSWRVVALVPVC